MESIDTIVVPTDFSDCAPGVVRQAAQLASKVGARVVVMHAVEAPAGLGGSVLIQPSDSEPPIEVVEHLRRGAAERMPKLLAVAQAEGVAVGDAVVHGKPVDAILEAAELLEADLIVMGTHGRRGLNRALLGSVAESVLRRADVPVMTVRTQWHPGCEAGSCATCKTHLLREQIDAQVEQDG
jgi:universal stress protein A